MADRQRVFAAMHAAIVPQLQAFKVDLLTDGSERRCPDTGTVLEINTARVVYRPLPFERLARDFLAEYGVAVDDVVVAENDERGALLSDERLDRYWTAYHAINAGLVLVLRFVHPDTSTSAATSMAYEWVGAA